MVTVDAVKLEINTDHHRDSLLSHPENSIFTNNQPRKAHYYKKIFFSSAYLEDKYCLLCLLWEELFFIVVFYLFVVKWPPQPLTKLCHTPNHPGPTRCVMKACITRLFVGLEGFE